MTNPEPGAATPGQAAGVHLRSTADQVRMRAFNALTVSIPFRFSAGDRISVKEHYAMADAVVAAIEPLIREDERAAIAAAAPAARDGTAVPGRAYEAFTGWMESRTYSTHPDDCEGMAEAFAAGMDAQAAIGAQPITAVPGGPQAAPELAAAAEARGYRERLTLAREALTETGPDDTSRRRRALRHIGTDGLPDGPYPDYRELLDEATRRLGRINGYRDLADELRVRAGLEDQ